MQFEEKKLTVNVSLLRGIDGHHLTVRKMKMECSVQVPAEIVCVQFSLMPL